MKNKIAQAKEWTKEHKEQIAAYAFVGGVVTFYVGVIALAVKAQADYNAQQVQLQHNIEAAVARGAQVLPGPNETWWIIEPTT